ncbi:MAG: tryptophanase [Clostridia bacterium]|nr:tryptophanase [Clostridia bacterium]
MAKIGYYSRKPLPLEMHKVCVVQKTEIIPVEERVKAIRKAGFNTYRMESKDIYLDMLTDSGVNAMTNEQLGAMMLGDDCYAGSKTYYRLADKIKEIFNKDYFLPIHQGRACEYMLALAYVKPNPGSIVPMNFQFGTSVGKIKYCGGDYVICLKEEGFNKQSTDPFKGDFDLEKLEGVLKANEGKIAFVRIESGTNLIGGQPISLDNMLAVSELCKKYGVYSVLDASLLRDNLHFIKTRENKYKALSIREIVRKLSDAMDIIYFSARKLGFGRGGAIILNDEKQYEYIKTFVASFEGFPTFGGMSVKEMEAIRVGLDDTMDEDIISQGPQFIEYLANELEAAGIPVVTPPGGLGCHIDAMKFIPQIKHGHYPAGSLASAIYIASGARGKERGAIDEPWDSETEDEPYGAMELVRLAVPRRVYTVSQINYLVDRLCWLRDNKDLIGGLHFETKGPHQFYDALTADSDWPEKLAAKFREDFGDSL